MSNKPGSIAPPATESEQKLLLEYAFEGESDSSDEETICKFHAHVYLTKLFVGISNHKRIMTRVSWSMMSVLSGCGLVFSPYFTKVLTAVDLGVDFDCGCTDEK